MSEFLFLFVYFNALEHGLSNLPESTKASKEKFNQLLHDKSSAILPVE
jgi:tRNA dimethylallyltransferase